MIGDEIMVTISPEHIQAFFDGAWDEDEWERDVERWQEHAKTTSGFGFAIVYIQVDVLML